MKSINKYCKECAEIAESKGFDLKQAPEQLLLIASEVVECFDNIYVRGDNDVFDALCGLEYVGKKLEALRNSENYKKSKFEICPTNNLPEELADIVIRCFSFAGGNGIDLQKAIDEKIEINRSREHLHGKKF